jgi:hypothetical protein
MKSAIHSTKSPSWAKSLLGSAILAVALLTPALGQEKSLPQANLRKLAIQHEPGAVEVKFVDGSTVRLVVKDPSVGMSSPYGKLQVPIQEIERIDFATRVPEELVKRIETAVINLADSQFTVRQKASGELLKFGDRAYPALLRAAASKDPEVVRRAQEIIEIIRETLPEDSLETRDRDVIYTAHSKLAGRIDLAAFKVETAQFGELVMKLSDARSLRSLSAPEGTDDDGGRVAEADPGNLQQYMNQIGKILRFRIVGGMPGAAQPPMGVVLGGAGLGRRGGGVVFGPGAGLWGTDIYTADSSLALAAVHAGILKQGQQGIVRVKIVPPPDSFEGSTRNGMTSGPYGQFPGAFKVMR